MRNLLPLTLLLFPLTLVAEDALPRKTTSLNGEWQFQQEPPSGGTSPQVGAPLRKDGWKKVAVPQAWEHHEGMAFDGVGWYRKELPALDLKPGRRLLLHFDAVATHATVFWNGAKLGEHLGPWTPFRFDVTEEIRKAPKGPHVIEVRVDEKVGHNTQGFLPIIQPHFGGIWQEVKLIEVGAIYIDDLQAAVFPEGTANDSFNLEVRLDGPHAQEKLKVFVGYCPASHHKMMNVGVLETRDHPKKPKNLGPEGFEPAPGVRVQPSDSLLVQHDWLLTPVPQWVVVKKNGLLRKRFWSLAMLDGPWAPWAPMFTNLGQVTVTVRRQGSDDMLDSITIPFRRRTIETKGDQFLLNGQPLIVRGVLNWGYYPPNLAPNPDPEVWRRDLRLIKSWGFNLMKCCLWVPPKRFLEIADEEGVLLWIEYPTWHPKLDQQHRADLVREYTEFFHHDRNHPSVILRSLTCETGHQADLAILRELYDLGRKLIPGSLIVDDSSWIEWNRIYDFYDDHPYGNNHTWVPTLTRLKEYIAKKGTKPLVLGEAIAADTWVQVPSLLEGEGQGGGASRGAVPPPSLTLPLKGGGNQKEKPYWQPIFLDANRAWLARMEKAIGGPIDQERLRADSLRYAWLMRKYQIETFRREVPNGGYVVSVLRDFPLASMGLIDYEGKPKWEAKDWAWHGEQKRADEPWPKCDVAKHGDFGWPDNMLWIDYPPASDELRKVIEARARMRSGKLITHPLQFEPNQLVVTQTLNEKLMAHLESGGKVLLIPNGKQGSLPLKSHWFLRGGPFVNTHHPLIKNTKGLHELLVENQHFDLAGDVIPDVQYLEEIDPILMLWDNHDIPQVKTHGLVFETRVGKGRLFVSALNHEKKAGRELLDVFLHHLDQGPPPRNGLKPETIAGLKAKLREKKLDLVSQDWKFKPESKDGDGAISPTGPIGSWKPIKLGQHWEGQGYPTLDGWAWYRLDMKLPADWQGQPIYWHCDGVDDHAVFYVNGQSVGTMGDLANKKTAFEDKASFDITKHAKPGETIKLAIKVYDWYGAGGCHRPQWLSTVPRSTGPEILK